MKTLCIYFFFGLFLVLAPQKAYAQQPAKASQIVQFAVQRTVPVQISTSPEGIMLKVQDVSRKVTVAFASIGEKQTSHHDVRLAAGRPVHPAKTEKPAIVLTVTE